MNHTRLQISFFLILILATFSLVFFIFKPYFVALFLAVIFAIVFRPVYHFIRRRFERFPSIASIITVLFVLTVILLPFTFFTILLFDDARDLYFRLSVDEFSSLEALTATLEGFLERYIPNVSLDIESYVRQVLDWLVGNLGQLFSGFVRVIIGLLVMIIALFYLFRDGDALKERLLFFSPLDNKFDEGILAKLEKAVNSVVKGSLLIATIQGIVAGVGFVIFGIPDPILWGSVAAIAGLIPGLGTTIVVVPAVIYLFVAGHTLSAVGLLAWGAIAVGLIDNVLNPYLIERGTKLHPFLILLSVIGGLAFFGPIGFLAGPVVLSLLFALLDIYPLIITKGG